jgi:hypothetical protein
MSRDNKLSITVWAVILAIFALGSVTGAAIHGLYQSRSAAEFRAPSIKDGEVYFQSLKQELSLTPAQASEIHSVLDQTREEYKGVCSEVRPLYDSVRDRARTRMRVLLTGDQQQRFDQMVTQENCHCPADQNK